MATPMGRTVERREMTIPYYVEEGTILHGFHQAVLHFTNNDTGDEIGSMSCGAGLGTDVVMMSWTNERTDERHHACLWMRDMFKTWVETIDPDGAKALPGPVKVDFGRACPNCGREVALEELRMAHEAMHCIHCQEQEEPDGR